MQVLSINVGTAEPMKNAKVYGKTGIYKRPVAGPVAITVNGLVDDAICDTENHGGVDQAVYIYGTPDYDWWSVELGQALAPGTFGENLTITELESAQLVIGTRLHIGSVIVEITAPRVPCVTLARRMNDPAFLKRFRAAERPGVYCRVIQAGDIQAGDAVTIQPYQGEPITAIELFRTFFAAYPDAATLRRQLAAPIAIRDRVAKEQQLREIEAKQTAA
jgi:MOSC domain-containing protein YiiM